MSTLKFLGASGTVTGSCYLLTPNSGKPILIDMGMFQGSREVDDLNYMKPEFDPTNLGGVILTHAHLDHCGRLPTLTQSGFKGTIYMTEPTRVLSELTLLDSAKINKDNQNHLPLYQESDVFRTISQMQVEEYDKKFSVGPFEIILRDAGHILGSASIEIIDTSHPQKTTFAFSGDLGNSPEEIVKPTFLIEKADIVIMESTYGDRSHSDENPDKVLQEEINAIEESGGTLLVPAFSLERVQEILHKIDHLKRELKIKEKTQVYLDSPMAIKATNVYKQFKNLYTQELMKHAKNDDPFDFPGLHLVESHKQSLSIHQIEGPKVIIAGSGMMSGGRILSHALFYLGDAKTRLLVVGFQAEQTLGRKIIDGQRAIKIDNREVFINATVRKSSAMSAHADQPKLLKWFDHIKGVKQLYLVHGENIAREAFSQVVRSRTRIKSIHMPTLNEVYQI